MSSISEGLCSVAFADWIDEKIRYGQINRLKEDGKKWFYNHKPKSQQGFQQWEKYTTSELFTIFTNTEFLEGK